MCVVPSGAALRSGAGLVRCAVPESLRQLFCPPFDALIFNAVPDEGKGFFTEAALPDILEHSEESDAVVLGPGIGTADETCQCVRELLQVPVPLVLDADGLTILSRYPQWAKREAPLILTPHPGEMRRLLTGFGLEEHMSSPRHVQACTLAEAADAWVAYKGLGTIIAAPDQRWAVNTTGNDGLASAGTGDILAGLLGGFTAQGWPLWEAVSHAVCVHGLLGELAPNGTRSVVADDLLQTMPRVVKELTAFP